ncbi:hypothetical protein ACIUV6_04560 [Pseudomonas aeruginosa]|uniref:hypothetical protein n=1 Tax=Pseudomonas aeruginosa TaxID=287 RepID=UPI0008FB7321|nr:hypothetical protein [Pseudomonas aeruginosa]HCL2747457.1 hypothetical protein [Pseudomonas aeruginosa 449A]EKU1368088.1 hypothetical protein [Pseudomonas aeruginosa]EKV8081217.1 hypothetical protein [Pseudomonas aeruginosa]KAB0739296.1 ATP-binding protein [Pseudomonas aeruginosa]MBG5783183.1 ATP-binding protein [Pseudomonas aeruginosa]
MKKLHSERKQFVISAGRARWRNALARRNIVYDANRFYKAEKYKGRTRIVAPEKLSVYSYDGTKSAYVETMKFVSKIERNFRKTDCYVDFRNTKSISAAAMVLVYAAVDLAAKISGRDGEAEILWSNASERVNAILKGNNLHKLIRGRHVSYSLEGVRTMPIISSVGKQHMEEVIDFIQRRIYKERMTPDTEHAYGDAVSETINNVRLHAYPNLDNSEKRWWLVCHTIGKMLYLAIYDRGVGIPKTVVERSWFLSSLKYTQPEEYAILEAQFPELTKGWDLHVFNRISDEKLIYLSMQGDVTGTKSDKHGQGSKSILALVNDTPGGQLWVFSNDGLYKFRQTDEKPVLFALPKTFPGTLIQWNIELP